MIKAGNIYLLLIALVLFLSGCDKESNCLRRKIWGLSRCFPRMRMQILV